MSDPFIHTTAQSIQVEDTTRNDTSINLPADLKTRCLTPDGTRIQIKDEALKHQDKLKESSQEYYTTKLIYDILQDVVVFAPGVGFGHTQANWPEAIRQNIMAAECEYYQLVDPKANTTTSKTRQTVPLGVLPTDYALKDEWRRMSLIKDARIELEGRVERAIEECVCALDRAARICGLKPASSSDQMDSVPSVEEAAALADLIETKLDALDRLSRECDALDARLQTGTFAHLRVEHDTADILLTLLQDSNTDASLAEAFAEYFGGIVESTRLKLAVLHAEIQRTMYSGRAVDVLRRLKDLLLAEQMAVEKELTESLAKLHEYQSAGPEYQAIATEHGAILAAIEEAEEDMRRIQLG